MEEGIRDKGNITELKRQFINMVSIYLNCHSKTEVSLHTNTKFGMQHYLQVIDDFYTRRSICKLRCSAHCLAIEVGRYSKIDRCSRVCMACNKEGVDLIEDEHHLLGRCTLTRDIRKTNNVNEGTNLLEVLSGTVCRPEIKRIGSIIHAMYSKRCESKTEV